MPSCRSQRCTVRLSRLKYAAISFQESNRNPDGGRKVSEVDTVSLPGIAHTRVQYMKHRRCVHVLLQLDYFLKQIADKRGQSWTRDAWPALSIAGRTLLDLA